MASQMKTPGVYIKETDAFPNSVEEVATAIPAFVGYTEKADWQGKALSNQPTRITSMAEFLDSFGGVQKVVFRASKPAGTVITSPGSTILVGSDMWDVAPLATREQIFLLYRSMELFFRNGGAACYVVSVGSYQDAIAADALIAGIETLTKEQEPTLLVVPDAMHLPVVADCTRVQQEALRHCGGVMQSRMAILDVYDGYLPRDAMQGDPVLHFRTAIGENFLSYAAAYYPWVETSLVDVTDVGCRNVVAADLSALLSSEAAQSGTTVPVSAGQIAALASATDAEVAAVQAKLTQASSAYRQLMTAIQWQQNLLPPAAAMAGVYTMVDATRGVWKAPANVSLNSVVKPAVVITQDAQEDLNVPLEGKAINAIRTFVGQGVLVWGARTLDGNSQDWRYINVRRTLIMLEQSIKLAAQAYVFEPNTANTWSTVTNLISSFLTDVWKRGGLAGATPADAFAVDCGLGETMTSDDVLGGSMRITVKVAIIRPAEFIEMSFQQLMPTS